jgi:hypothetical protein
VLTAPTFNAARAPSRTAIDCKKLDAITDDLPSLHLPGLRSRIAVPTSYGFLSFGSFATLKNDYT